MMNRVLTGSERLLEDPPRWLKPGVRVGMLTHTASIDSQYRLVVERFLKTYPGNLKALFGPQHGIWGEKQDNMIESPHEYITSWGLPSYSLYGESRAPTKEVLGGLDVLIVDLQDVGCRVYTYLATLLGCMEVCQDQGLSVVILDRPNPIGGRLVEGNLLIPSCFSFVGPHSLPIRHGMTLGELACLLKAECRLDLQLEVIPMLGWNRAFYFQDTGLPWVPPSPNIPIPQTCLVYPGQVLLEGTNLSEGRGTTRPFEVFGAPFVDPFKLRERLQQVGLPGVCFRAVYFEPTFNKWRGQRCGGIHIHVTDSREYRPYFSTLWILHEILREWGDELKWRDPPYEYEAHRLPLDLLIGDPSVREALENLVTPEDMTARWLADLTSWRERTEAYFVYA